MKYSFSEGNTYFEDLSYRGLQTQHPQLAGLPHGLMSKDLHPGNLSVSTRPAYRRHAFANHSALLSLWAR